MVQVLEPLPLTQDTWMELQAPGHFEVNKSKDGRSLSSSLPPCLPSKMKIKESLVTKWEELGHPVKYWSRN